MTSTGGLASCAFKVKQRAQAQPIARPYLFAGVSERWMYVRGRLASEAASQFTVAVSAAATAAGACAWAWHLQHCSDTMETSQRC